MSVRPTRKSSALVALFVILALLLPVSSSSLVALPSPAPAGATPAAGSPPPPTLTTAERPLGELLRPDGTLDLNSGYRGSLDPAGWRLAGDAAAPRFVPAITPAAPGDEYWADGIGLPGLPDWFVPLAVDGAGNMYAGGENIAKWDGTAWSSLGSIMGDGSSYYVRVDALAVDGAGRLYAGGRFTTAGGVSANNIAQWDGTAWSPLGSGVDSYALTQVVEALVVDGAGNAVRRGHLHRGRRG